METYEQAEPSESGRIAAHSSGSARVQLDLECIDTGAECIHANSSRSEKETDRDTRVRMHTRVRLRGKRLDREV